MIRKPDFICIGASKSGTTWLYYQLKKHPQIWLPQVKELHYMDLPEIGRLGSMLLKNRVFGTHVRSAAYRCIKKGQLVWLLRYLFSKRRVETYHYLFKPRKDQICGEITPSYAKLSESKIAEIHHHYPSCKLIYILRDPVERTWSHLNMLRKRSSTTTYSDHDLLKRLNHRQIAESNYIKNLNSWSSYYAQDQIFIGFYEELKNTPEVFLNKLFKFLKVTNIQHTKNLTLVVNKGNYDGIEPVVRKALVQTLINEIEAIDKKFDNSYTNKWVSRAQQLIHSLALIAILG